jgi:hypothetical protein
VYAGGRPLTWRSTSAIGQRDSLWKHEACVNEDVSVVHAHHHAVHADLPQASNGEHADRRPLPARRPWERPLPCIALGGSQVVEAVAAHDESGLTPGPAVWAA